jgi:hypothetical protein
LELIKEIEDNYNISHNHLDESEVDSENNEEAYAGYNNTR